jgi:hypothetical protein
MLNCRSLKRFILISLAMMGMAVSSANATSLHIDFGNEGAATSDYAAAADQKGYWNNINRSGTTPGLLDLDGVSTEIDLLLSGSNLLNGFSGGTLETDIYKLLRDYFYTGGNTDDWSLTISGLDEGKYDIYYYAPNSGVVATGAFSINGSRVASLPGVNTKPPTLEQGVSWDVLAGVSIGSAGLLMEFMTPTATPGAFFGLAGLQIVQVSAGIPPIPVPAAVWLFGTSLIGMVGFVRRRKAA